MVAAYEGLDVELGQRMMELGFWGVRGSIPAPGPATVRYGGNTACVSVRPSERRPHHPRLRHGRAQPRHQPAGRRRSARAQGEASILLSHAHWDHIQGFPFFVPLYQPGNRFHIFGGAKSSAMLEGILEGQMAPQYFPVQTLKNMGASIDIVAIAEGKAFEVERCQVRARMNPHGRAGALAFRIEDGGRVGGLRERRRLRARAARRPSRSSCTGARTC